MKKVCVVIFLLALLVCAITPSVALAADEPAHVWYVVGASGRYSAFSLALGTTPIGARFYSEQYFGNSDIPVTVDLFSNSKWDLNFCLGDADFSETPADPSTYVLTAQQTQTKRDLLALFDQIDSFVYQVDCDVNTQIATSDVYRYNHAQQGERLEISAHTYNILQIAAEMYIATDGAFNPAVYRLVDLWGFSSRVYGGFAPTAELLPYDRDVSPYEFHNFGYPLPQDKYVQAFSKPEFTDFSGTAVTLSAEGGKYYVTKNVAPVTVDGQQFDQWIDLGGVAKGYVADYITNLVVQAGFDGYYIDAGSSSSTFGVNHNGGKFHVGLQNPYRWIFNLVGLDISNTVISTSGQYMRNYTVDGVEYAHILDGTTGAPAQTGLKEIFVAIPTGDITWASRGDCLTTALTVMGRDNLVRFVNGYLKENNISIIAVYETLDGKKEILSNFDVSDFSEKGSEFDEFAWALVPDGNGNYVYNEDATFPVQVDAYKVALIVLAGVFGAALVALVVYHIVRGKKSLQNVQHARRDKPFKPADVVLYLGVVLVIVVLFAYVFGGASTSWDTVQIVDCATGEQLFIYRASRNEWKINSANLRGWDIQVENTDQGITVTLSRDDGNQRFNKLEITRGAKPTVKMVDAECGFHKDCVRNFGAVDVSGGAIVCSPNNIKVTTE